MVSLVYFCWMGMKRSFFHRKLQKTDIFLRKNGIDSTKNA